VSNLYLCFIVSVVNFISTWFISIYASLLALLILLNHFGLAGNLREVVGMKIKEIAAQIGPSRGQASTRLASVMHRVRSKFANPLGPPFVAAFCQSNVGDTSPNTQGAFCLDSGIQCDFNHSTCNGKNELCVGRGPA
jgi:hypothetical protein